MKGIRVGLGTIGIACLLAGGCSGGGGQSAPPLSVAGGESTRYETLLVHVMRATADGKRREIGTFERPLTDFRDVPISVFVRKLRAAGEVGADSPEQFETRVEIGARRMPLPIFNLDCSKPDMCISRDWLDLELKAPGAAPRHVERTLFARTDDNPEPPGFRRHTIVVAPDRVARDDVKRRVAAALGGPAIEQGRARAERVRTSAETAKPAQRAALLAQLDDIDATGTVGQLIALEHAADSDLVTDRLARELDVTVRYATPRILITTVQASEPGDDPSVSLDLRLDEVAATSSSVGLTRLFQHTRGIQESEIEGILMRAYLGADKAASTAFLMSAARKDGVDVLEVSKKNRDDLSALDLPQDFSTIVNAALDRGHHVVLPRSAVDLAGRPRWGFWDIDPATGVTVGVMEDGENQGLGESVLTNKSVAQSPELGYCLGFMQGTVLFQWTLMAGVLEFGGITPQLVSELKTELGQIACNNLCNVGAEAKIEVSITQCTLDAKKEVSGVPEDWAYCTEFKNGFECATGVLLAALQSPGDLPTSQISPSATINIPCFLKGGG